MVTDHEKSAVRKIFWRLVPLLMLGSGLNYLDRVNLGFAALQMNQALGLTASAFGFAAGLTFVSYCFFEVPSNLALHRLGARIWLARIMVTWGIISALTAFVVGPYSLYAMRFILGAAEAGYAPGAFLYMSYWIPKAYRGKALALFLLAQVLSIIIGAPLSSFIMNSFDKFGGLGGWQWMFLLEGIPAAIVGVVFFFFLTDRPSQAKWLTPEERKAIIDRIDADDEGMKSNEHASVGQMLKITFTSSAVLLLSLTYVSMTMSAYGIGFFLPQIIQAAGFAKEYIGWMVALPSACAALTMFFWGRWSDRARYRERVVSTAFICLAAGLVGMATISTPWLQIVAVCLASIGLWGVAVSFWPLPTLFLSRDIRPAGLAAVNSLGTIGGFVSPYLFGLAKDATGDYKLGIAMLVTFALLGSVIAFVHRPPASGDARPTG